MPKKKLTKFFCALGICIVGIAATVITQPPLFTKWLIGSARRLGQPIKSAVYSNGKLNSDMQVFHAKSYWKANDTADYFVLYLENDSLREIIIVNKLQSFVARPQGTSDLNYDIIRNTLYQGEVGAHMIDFRNGLKGFGFEPNLEFNILGFRFNLPDQIRSKTGIDSIRVQFN